MRVGLAVGGVVGACVMTLKALVVGWRVGTAVGQN